MDFSQGSNDARMQCHVCSLAMCCMQPCKAVQCWAPFRSHMWHQEDECRGMSAFNECCMRQPTNAVRHGRACRPACWTPPRAGPATPCQGRACVQQQVLLRAPDPATAAWQANGLGAGVTRCMCPASAACLDRVSCPQTYQHAWSCCESDGSETSSAVPNSCPA